MKVCMAVMNTVTHDSRVLKEAEILSDKGYEVHIVGLQISSEELFEKKRSVYIHRIKAITKENIFRHSIFNFLKYYLPLFTFGNQNTKRMFKKMIQIDADLYHAHDLDTLLCSYKAARKKSTFLVYDSHELFTETMNQGIANKLFQILFYHYYSFIERILIQKANLVITVSDSIAQELKKRYNIRQPLVIRNVPELFQSLQTVNLKATYHLPQINKILLYQGSLQKGRGLKTLIESMTLLPDSYSLVIIGDGPMKKNLKELTKKLNINNVTFIDAVQRDVMPSYTKNADYGIVFLENKNLNQYYSLPNKLFEYMSCSLPVIAMKLPEIEKIVREEKIGVLIPSLSPQHIANAVKKMDNPHLVKKFRENAFRAFHREYNWDLESKKFIDAYKSLISLET